jgi:uncharacterized protein DUF2381
MRVMIAVLGLLVTAQAAAEARSRTITIPPRPADGDGPTIYLQSESATTLVFDEAPKGVSVSGPDGRVHTDQILKTIVLYPLPALTEQDKVKIVVTAADGTKLPFTVVMNGKDFDIKVAVKRGRADAAECDDTARALLTLLRANPREGIKEISFQSTSISTSLNGQKLFVQGVLPMFGYAIILVDPGRAETPSERLEYQAVRLFGSTSGSLQILDTLTGKNGSLTIIAQKPEGAIDDAYALELEATNGARAAVRGLNLWPAPARAQRKRTK